MFSKTGVTVSTTVTFKSGDSSFASQITSVVGAAPDVLAMAAGPDDAGRIAKEARSQNLRSVLLGTGALQSGGAAYVAAGGEATEGAFRRERSTTRTAPMRPRSSCWRRRRPTPARRRSRSTSRTPSTR